MTLEEIRNVKREYLLPNEIASIIGCDAQDIRVAAREKPELLGFNVCVIGSRVKIPKRAFIAWCEGVRT